MTDERTIWLGALLHDIGKFRERTFEPLPGWAKSYRAEAKYSHEPFSAVFVEEYAGGWTEDKQTLRQLVLKHHDPSLPDERLVQLADNLSAYERAEVKGDEEGARGRAESVLRTVFSRVSFSGRKADEALSYDLAPFSLDNIMPHKEVHGSQDKYRTLWRDFTEEVGRIPSGSHATLLSVLKKYTWTIPSDTRYQTVPDVSLYDHLKTTAAIAVCLAREGLRETELQRMNGGLIALFKKERPTPGQESLLNRPFCALVKGDISGTQDFLYLLTSSGAARGLRGRSFYLQLLTETVAGWILRKLRIPQTNVLFIGGGHFYLLVPHRDIRGCMDDLRRHIAEKLWNAHKGDLSLTVDYAPVNVYDFIGEEADGNGFAEKWGEASGKVNARKQRKWANLDAAAILDKLFSARQQGTTAEQMCQVCHDEWREHLDNLDDGIRKCRRCHSFEKLGNRLRNPTHLVLFTVPASDMPEHAAWDDVLHAFGTEARLVEKEEVVPSRPHNAKTATIYTLESSDFLTDEIVARFRWDGLPVSFDHRLLAGATPIKKDEKNTLRIAEFSDLAEASEGVKWLGVLRMDVDNLGEVFRKGLSNHATISRMSTLSESLRLFFEGRVPRLCRRHNPVAQDEAEERKEDGLYLIYAGGDDVFIVGAWSILPGLAKRIRDDFTAFIGGSHVTLSGGIAIEHAKYPLYQLARDAHDALDNGAKEYTRSKRNQHIDKDAISFLQTPMGWEQFDEVCEWKQKLLAMLHGEGEKDALPRAFLGRLSEIHALFADNKTRRRRLHGQGVMKFEEMEEMIAYDKWRWRLVYQLGRFGERYPHYKEEIHRLQQSIMREEDGLIAALHVLARWTALTLREGDHR